MTRPRSTQISLAIAIAGHPPIFRFQGSQRPMLPDIRPRIDIINTLPPSPRFQDTHRLLLLPRLLNIISDLQRHGGTGGGNG